MSKSDRSSFVYHFLIIDYVLCIWLLWDYVCIYIVSQFIPFTIYNYRQVFIFYISLSSFCISFPQPWSINPMETIIQSFLQ